jgi:hypothetical protein
MQKSTRHWRVLLFVYLFRGGFFYDFRKDFGVEFGEFGEHLSVEFDAFLCERSDELAVRRDCCVFKRANSGVNLYVPQFAVIAFFVSAVVECALSGMHDCIVCHDLFFAAAETIALYLLEDVLSGLIRNGTPFYACHSISVIYYYFGRINLLRDLLLILKPTGFFAPSCLTRDLRELK